MYTSNRAAVPSVRLASRALVVSRGIEKGKTGMNRVRKRVRERKIEREGDGERAKGLVTTSLVMRSLSFCFRDCVIPVRVYVSMYKGDTESCMFVCV